MTTKSAEQRPRLSARRVIQPGNPKNYFVSINDLPRGTKVVLWLRVSTWAQRNHIDHQENSLWDAATVRCLRVVGSYWRISQAFQYPTREIANSGWYLETAAADAKEKGAVLLGESVCRYVRPADFHPTKNPDTLPTRSEFEELRQLTFGVLLATLLPPDTPSAKVRSYQTKRGQSATGQYGGRPLVNDDQQGLLNAAWQKLKQLSPIPR